MKFASGLVSLLLRIALFVFVICQLATALNFAMRPPFFLLMVRLQQDDR